jgi:NTE family protein
VKGVKGSNAGLFRRGAGMRKGNKLGLVLGGGGARGFAHIGALKVLEAENIRPDIVLGTSVGSIVGGALASGMTAEQIEERAKSFLESDLYASSELKAMGDAESGAEKRLSSRIQSYFRTRIRLASALYKPGILPLDDMEECINYFIPDIKIEETAIPFRAVATDLKSGECVILKEGSLRRSLLASSAVPGAFPPVEMNGRHLSDGGIICTVPVGCALKEGADRVIAIAIDRDIILSSELHTAVDIYVRAGEIQGFHLEEYELERADLVIRPKLGGIHWTDFSRSPELISMGEAAARERIAEIRGLARSISRWRFSHRIKRAARRLVATRPPGIGL